LGGSSKGDSAINRRIKSFDVALKKAITSRGQNAWVDAKGSWAITDFNGSYPIFYDAKQPKAGFSLSPWSFGIRHGSPEAWKSLCAFGGLITNQAFPQNIKRMEPRQAGWIKNGKFRFCSIATHQYRFSRSEIGNLSSASRRIFSIGVEFLKQRLNHEKEVVLFFSSGSDSLLVALMLQEAGISFRAVTTDYGWKRYSEHSEALLNAGVIGMPLSTERITAQDYWSSFLAIHHVWQDCPCANASSSLWHALAIKSLPSQSGVVVTGDHADSLFLGFAGMHQSMPNHPEEYWKKEKRMSLAEKCARALPFPRKSDQPEIEKLGKMSGAEVEKFLKHTITARRKELEETPGGKDLPTLQQRGGQIRAGIPWQHNFLFVERALPNIRFVSPFYDPKMIQFAIAMKPSIKAGNGQPKRIIHFLIKEKTGGTVPKKANPFPLRIWTFVMPLYVIGKIPADEKVVLLMAWVKNLILLGQNYQRLLSLAAALLWKKKISEGSL